MWLVSFPWWGLDLGLIAEGDNNHLGIDNNKNATETYKANSGDHIMCADINQLIEQDSSRGCGHRRSPVVVFPWQEIKCKDERGQLSGNTSNT
jgi:hypothetical protein